MTASMATKLIIGLGASSISATGGYGIYELVRTKSIEELLKGEFELLDTTEATESTNRHQKEWEEKVEPHASKTEVKAWVNSNSWSSDTSSEDTRKTNNTKLLREKCKTEIESEKNKRNKNLENIKKYCSKKITQE